MMNKRRFSKKALAGIMSLALAASVVPSLNIPNIAIIQAEEAGEPGSGSTPTSEIKPNEKILQGELKKSGCSIYEDMDFSDQGEFKGYLDELDSQIVVYANGGTYKYKVDNKDQKINYKSKTLYTDYYATTHFEKDTSKGKIKATAGKVIAGIVEKEPTPDALKGVYAKGKINDTAAKDIAKATVKNGVITVTAGKKGGSAYLVIMDTGLERYVYQPVEVRVAPTKLEAFSDEACTQKLKDFTVNSGSKENSFYLKESAKDMKVSREGDLDSDIKIEPDDKSKDYFAKGSIEAVDEGTENDRIYKITVTGKKLKDSKITKGKLIVENCFAAKKISIPVTVVNKAKTVTVQKGSEAVTSPAKISGQLKNEAAKGTFSVEVTKESSAEECTDAPKLYRVSGDSKPTFSKGKPSTAMSGDSTFKGTLKSGNIEITVKKGTADGTKGYFLVYYNDNAYKIFEVVAEDTTPAPAED